MQQPTKIIKSFENSELSLWIASKSGDVGSGVLALMIKTMVIGRVCVLKIGISKQTALNQ